MTDNDLYLGVDCFEVVALTFASISQLVLSRRVAIYKVNTPMECQFVCPESW